MTLVIDAQIAGISGDMMLCSLVHMGANASRIESAIKNAASKSDANLNDVGFDKVKRNGLEATALRLDVTDQKSTRNAVDLRKCILDAVESEGLSQKAKTFAASSMDTLVAAESKVHGVEPSSVHLHEASSFDTIADILGTALALDDLCLFDERIVCTPVAVGGGTLTFSHGTTSNPASAILEILRCKGIQICGGPVDSELATPTGASMLVSLNPTCSRFYPPISPTSIGYGAGKADHKGFSNVLKMVQGKDADSFSTDRVRVLETSLDDVTGELVGHVIDELMRRGAKDVTVGPAITKKGRPTSLVTVICDASTYEDVVTALIRETGTLGVRVRDSERIVIERSLHTADVEIRGHKFKIGYKAASTRPPKAEHDDVAHVAAKLGITLHEARRLVDAAIGESQQ